MAERCNSCGAELFTGQQFCRACGAPTRQFSSEELPTQMLPPGGQEQPPTAQTPLATSPLPGRNTSDPVYGAADYSRYQPPVAPQRVTAPVVAPLAPPVARRRSHAWLYAVLGLLIFFAGASVVAGLFFMNRQAQRVTKTIVRPNVKVPMPPMPPPSHPMDMGAEGTEVSDGQTIITKTYPLAKDGSFSLRNFSGDITVEGWDEQQAEVKTIRRGGDDAGRAAFQVVQEEGTNRLVFNSMPEKMPGGAREVQYVVKLPRNLRELEIVSINSNVELANVHSTSISINVQRGNIELEDVSGTVNSRTTKGNTTVVLAEAAKDAPQVFNGIHGNIELELSPGTNAELKAETIDGDIEIDEDLQIKVERRMMGQQAVGRVGTGGQPIVVKVVSGNIKIKS
ncbi:MAG TPA: DUF4097 family beta strand repeat-containing protein [Pyrinomonadaceae bacterium]|jgi:hypothetical protein|nr:DUF4097 family beta strand repeat-containing protein [Pyrinomonadaceae bacterium]